MFRVKRIHLTDVDIQGIYGYPRFRMAGNDHVGRLSLGHQRLHDGINGVKLLARKGDTFPR